MSTRETVSYHRCDELRGVELRTVENAHDFSAYSCDYAFIIAKSWRGEVWHRRRRAILGSEGLLFVQPGDVFLGRGAVPGAVASLSIERELFEAYCEKHRISPQALRVDCISALSRELRERLASVELALRGGRPAETLGGRLGKLVAAWVHEQALSPVPEPRCEETNDAAELVRRCLHHDLSVSVDLATVAGRTGMSRFQALRVFKSWYGLPPHAYQLRVRLGLAQKSLRNGVCPAQAAAEYGFVDQSHLTRHFRRLLGVTPAEYARVAKPRSWQGTRRLHGNSCSTR